MSFFKNLFNKKQKNDKVDFEPKSNEIYQQWKDEMNSHWNDIPQENENSWDIEDRPTYT
ncbi:16069_t:CDS:1, partial [Racocetra fulgida]